MPPIAGDIGDDPPVATVTLPPAVKTYNERLLEAKDIVATFYVTGTSGLVVTIDAAAGYVAATSTTTASNTAGGVFARAGNSFTNTAYGNARTALVNAVPLINSLPTLTDTQLTYDLTQELQANYKTIDDNLNIIITNFNTMNSEYKEALGNIFDDISIPTLYTQPVLGSDYPVSLHSSSTLDYTADYMKNVNSTTKSQYYLTTINTYVDDINIKIDNLKKQVTMDTTFCDTLEDMYTVTGSTGATDTSIAIKINPICWQNRIGNINSKINVVKANTYTKVSSSTDISGWFYTQEVYDLLQNYVTITDGSDINTNTDLQNNLNYTIDKANDIIDLFNPIIKTADALYDAGYRIPKMDYYEIYINRFLDDVRTDDTRMDFKDGAYKLRGTNGKATDTNYDTTQQFLASVNDLDFKRIIMSLFYNIFRSKDSDIKEAYKKEVVNMMKKKVATSKRVLNHDVITQTILPADYYSTRDIHPILNYSWESTAPYTNYRVYSNADGDITPVSGPKLYDILKDTNNNVNVMKKNYTYTTTSGTTTTTTTTTIYEITYETMVSDMQKTDYDSKYITETITNGNIFKDWWTESGNNSGKFVWIPEGNNENIHGWVFDAAQASAITKWSNMYAVINTGFIANEKKIGQYIIPLLNNYFNQIEYSIDSYDEVTTKLAYKIRGTQPETISSYLDLINQDDTSNRDGDKKAYINMTMDDLIRIVRIRLLTKNDNNVNNRNLLIQTSNYLQQYDINEELEELYKEDMKNTIENARALANKCTVSSAYKTEALEDYRKISYKLEDINRPITVRRREDDHGDLDFGIQFNLTGSTYNVDTVNTQLFDALDTHKYYYIVTSADGSFPVPSEYGNKPEDYTRIVGSEKRLYHAYFTYNTETSVYQLITMPIGHEGTPAGLRRATGFMIPRKVYNPLLIATGLFGLPVATDDRYRYQPAGTLEINDDNSLLDIQYSIVNTSIIATIINYATLIVNLDSEYVNMLNNLGVLKASLPAETARTAEQNTTYNKIVSLEEIRTNSSLTGYNNISRGITYISDVAHQKQGVRTDADYILSYYGTTLDLNKYIDIYIKNDFDYRCNQMEEVKQVYNSLGVTLSTATSANLSDILNFIKQEMISINTDAQNKYAALYEYNANDVNIANALTVKNTVQANLDTITSKINGYSTSTTQPNDLNTIVNTFNNTGNRNLTTSQVSLMDQYLLGSSVSGSATGGATKLFADMGTVKTSVNNRYARIGSPNAEATELNNDVNDSYAQANIIMTATTGTWYTLVNTRLSLFTQLDNLYNLMLVDDQQMNSYISSTVFYPSSSIYADGAPPENPQNYDLNMDGWYFKNINGPPQKINWYAPPSTTTPTVADIKGLYLTFLNGLTTIRNNTPFITIYTSPDNDTSWYKSKRTYLLENAPLAQTNYTAFLNKSGTCSDPVHVNSTLMPLILISDATIQKGDFNDDEIILAFAIGTNSGSPINSVELVAQIFGVMYNNDYIQEFVYKFPETTSGSALA